MAWTVDARVPVRFGSLADAGADDAVLSLVAAGPGTLHAAACLCCRPRGLVATELARLFQARAKGAVPFFRAVVVVVSPGGEAAVRTVIAAEPLVSGRFRMA